MGKKIKIKVEIDATRAMNKGIGDILKYAKLGTAGRVFYDPGNGPWGTDEIGTWKEVTDGE